MTAESARRSAAADILGPWSDARGPGHCANPSCDSQVPPWCRSYCPSCYARFSQLCGTCGTYRTLHASGCYVCRRRGGFPVTRHASVSPPPGALSYVEYLQREIEDRLQGCWTCCGPPIADYPTLVDRIWPYRRPNYELEARLEAELREIEAQLRAAEAELEI